MPGKKKDYLNTDVEKVNSFREMIELAAYEAGDKIAYKYKSGNGIAEVTYSQFIQMISKLGAFLYSLGLSDKNIACTGPNSFKWILSYFTVLRSEGVFVPIDKELPDEDMLHLIKNSGAKAIFCSAKAEDIIKENKDMVPDLEFVICFDREEDDGMYLSFDRALEKGAGLSPVGFLHHPDRINKLKMIVYTSGTTGASKGVMLSEKNMVSCALGGLQVTTVFETGLSILPYHHTYEAVTDLIVSFHKHSTLCINESMNAILRNMKIYKPDYIFVVPALAQMMYSRIMRTFQSHGLLDELNRNIIKSNNLRKVGVDIRKEAFASIHDMFGGNLKLIVSGGAPLRPEIGKFFDDIGILFLNGYGITECSPLVSVNCEKYNNSETVGFPLPCVRIKIDEPNEEGIGEICVKGDTVMLGYFKNSVETEKVLNDGWFRTGDYGCINKTGQLMISGRKKNVIVLNNGKNIYPEEIENYIQGLDYISEVVVSGEKNDAGDEDSLIAEVYLNEIKTSSEVMKGIRNACRNLPIYKQISKVVIRDEEFEKTSSNKIKRSSAKGSDYYKEKSRKAEKQREKKEKKEEKKKEKKNEDSEN